MKKLSILALCLAAAACSQGKKSESQVPNERMLADEKPSPAPVPQPPAGTTQPQVPSIPQVENPKADQPKGTNQPAPQPQPQAPGGVVVGATPQPTPPPVTVVPIVPVLLAGPAGRPVIGSGPITDQIQDCWEGDPYACNIENIVAGQINGLRASYSLAPMLPNYQLGFSARDWSAAMAAAGVVSQPDLAARLLVMEAEFGAVNVVTPELVGASVTSVSIIDPMTGAILPPSAVNQIAAIVMAQILTDIDSGVLALDLVRSFGVGVFAANTQLYVTILYAD